MMQKESADSVSAATSRFMQSIQQRILNGDLRERESLPSERDLSEIHNISRTAVRIGLKQLEILGIVEGKPSSRRYIVNSAESLFSNYLAFQPMTEAYFSVIQNFRRVMEVGSADAIIDHSSAEDIHELCRINEQILDADRDGEAKGYSDYLFHRHLVGMADNSLVCALYSGMKDKILPVWQVGKETAAGCMVAYSSHNNIIYAIEQKDAETLRARLHRHMDEGMAYLPEGEV